ncbi:CAP domain-containing protein [Paracrocinitomix mangrovi]|uniref:CAP domain-containing protein n=1 Tax=Paracrocinitomix mangrovi TaxID=2862509 RepID=UPI001C8E333C|nr:CAP domain-containing protein [Paracrocinitomix mangrovi]UKN02926.1 CAP domain-containing protein [Paracrocinitomix mangrovi]
MFKTKSYLLLLLLIGLQFNVFSQSHKDSVSVDNFNEELADSLIFNLVNRERMDRNMPKLFKSERLSKASNVHAGEIKSSDKLTYSDTQSGECIQINEIKNGFTYDELVKVVFKKWIKSPGHEKLLMGEFFLYGGVSIQLKKVESKVIIYAVMQVSYNE